MAKRILSASRKLKLSRLLKACDKAHKQADKFLTKSFNALDLFEAGACGFPLEQAPELIEEYRRLIDALKGGEGHMEFPCDEYGNPVDNQGRPVDD